ncbi:MAG: glycosyltransferase [Acidobacteria bacterium]|nr:glycosyltransferase [Acidobacteriota bacterium]
MPATNPNATARPVFSIITPVYNGENKIEKTISSVLSQDADLFEYIILDGGSTDKTNEILKKYGDALKIFFGPDKGVYDAMNKGIALSSGRYLYFLGAGDTLQTGILREAAKGLPQHDLAFVYGNVCRPGSATRYHGQISSLWLGMVYNICHQSIFYGREVFELLGDYDIRYRLLADYVMNIKCFGSDKIEKKYLDVVVAEYEGSGMSHNNEDWDFVRDFPSLVKNNLRVSNNEYINSVFHFLSSLKVKGPFRKLRFYLYSLYFIVGRVLSAKRTSVI